MNRLRIMRDYPRLRLIYQEDNVHQRDIHAIINIIRKSDE